MDLGALGEGRDAGWRRNVSSAGNVIIGSLARAWIQDGWIISLQVKSIASVPFDAGGWCTNLVMACGRRQW